jgi:phosphatidylglycerol:prolipoprotein diacylglycerol transferase
MLPILYQSNSFILYSYPLFMGLGWGIAYQILFELLPSTFTRTRALILFWGMFLFSWLGAKILFLYTVPEQLSVTLVQETSFWLGGGFVFYGGLLGGLLYLAILKGLRFPLNAEVLWCLIPPLTIGHAIGRFGCFLAGCCYGKETDLFWGVFLHGAKRHPTQLLEFVSLLALGLFLLRSKKPKTELVSIYLMTYGLLRFGIEFLRGDLIRGTWGSFTPSQWISITLIVAGTVIYARKNNLLQRID